MSSTKNPQSRPAGLLGPLVVGLYAWAAAVSFGIALIDVVYARLVPEATAAFSEVADFLLLVSAATVLVALTAIGLSWHSRVARNFLIASLVVSLFGFLAPALLSPFLQDGSALGAGIRLVIGGAISILAFIGFHKFRLRGEKGADIAVLTSPSRSDCMTEAMVVYPHEFFRIDFDEILKEGQRQERIWAANAGEAKEVRLLHDYYDLEVLPLIVADDWVFEGAKRLALEWAQDCFDQLRQTGHEVYRMQRKLQTLKDEVVDFLARAIRNGWTKSKSEQDIVDLRKPSDFYEELLPCRINERGAYVKAQALRDKAREHERQQVRLIMTAARDLFSHVFPQIMFVVKRAIAVHQNLHRGAAYDEVSDPAEDLCWYESRVAAGTGAYLVTAELRHRYRIIRNAASHPGQFLWVPTSNVVRFEDETGRWVEFDVDDYHRYYRRLVFFCDLGIRGILSAYCDRARDDVSYHLVKSYFAVFPDDYRSARPGYCIPYSVPKP